MTSITKDMLILDALQQGKNIQAMQEVLLSIGMHCLGCALAKGETIEMAAAVHGFDANKLCEMLEEASNS